MASVKCKVVKGGEKYAVIADFAHGRLKDYNNTKFYLYKNTGISPCRKRKLVAEVDNMQYISQPSNEKSPKNKGLQYLVGIYDKETKLMKLHSTDIFHLKPKTLVNDDDIEEKERKTLSERERDSQLTAAFGSTKKKQKLASTRQNYLKKEAVEKAMDYAVDVALSEPLTTDSAAEDQNETNAVGLKYNKDATTPSDVYSLDDIVSPPIKDVLKYSAETFAHCTLEDISNWEEKKEFASSVVERLKQLPSDSVERENKSCILMYLQYLILFYTLKPRDFKGKVLPSLPEYMPQTIRNDLCRKFTVTVELQKGKNPSRCMPDRLREKLLGSILVLYLMLDNFDVEFQELLKDLKATEPKVTSCLAALGCTIRKSTVLEGSAMTKRIVKRARLTVPLTFAKAHRPKSRIR